ncbi:MAG: hypothetical protein AAFY42_00970 [Pseudomonadota bacterium]
MAETSPADFMKKLRELIAEYAIPFIILFAPLVGIAATGIAGTADRAGEVYDQRVIIGFLAATITAVIVTSIKVEESFRGIGEKIEATKKEFREEQEAATKSRKKIDVMDQDGFIKSFQRDIKNCDTVKNTFVKLSHNRSRNPSFQGSMVSLYNEFLANPANRWIDVTTHSDLTDHRYDRIRVSNETNGSFDIIVVDSSSDIINFVILEKRDKTTEVYFGWVKGSTDATEIFRTRDRSMISLIENYYRALTASPLEKTPAEFVGGVPQISATSKVLFGKWCAISVANEIQTVADIEKFSIVEIGAEGGRYFVNAKIYAQTSASVELTARIESEAAYLRDNCMSYEFIRKNIGNLPEGAGIGKLQPTDINDVIAGVYVRTDSALAVPINAVRLSDDFPSGNLKNINSVRVPLDRMIERRELKIKREFRQA